MSWPYPAVVAHRGGGTLAPENTLGAIRLGAELGFRGVEFDVMLAGDRTPVLIHDETTDRTTSVKGVVSRMSAAELKKLDVPAFREAGELCRSLGVWANVEIKPAKGCERETGEAVARMTRALWRGAKLAPILSSFSVAALEAARAATPDAAMGYLVDEVPADWRATMQRLDCVALHCNHEKLTEARAKEVKAAGYGLLCWTVNDAAAARRLRRWGVDCLVTDALQVITPDFR
jgi:glycerophosphoryl diester phosphodiesterase